MEKVLDDPVKFKGIDKSDMLQKAYSLPDMLDEGWKIAKGSGLKDLGVIENVAIAGMGGSAIGGDIVQTAFSDKLAVPVHVGRSYEIPNFVSERTLFIAVSYSGNTEETISALNKALARKSRVVTISSGGKLEALSNEAKAPHIKIPSGFPPRAALGYILPSLLYVFSALKLADGVEEGIAESVSLLRKLRKNYSIDEPEKSNAVKQMAIKIKGKVPIIMSCADTTYPAGQRLKTQLNENSKVTALHLVFPELNHNDLVNFSFLDPGKHEFFAIVLRDRSDYDRMIKRIEVTKSLVSGKLGGFNELWAEGRLKLARILSLIMFGDFLSIYLGVSLGIDPTPVTVIEQLKKELAR